MSETEPAIVLVVEDEPLVRLFVEEILSEDGGYTVITAAHADEALMVLEDRPDVRLVFTDINMPGSMNGLELAHRVQTRWPEVEVLVTSGAGLSGALPAGCRFLQKPTMPRALLAAVRDMLARAREPVMRTPLEETSEDEHRDLVEPRTGALGNGAAALGLRRPAPGSTG